MLVPLTQSLYAPGRLGKTDSVLVDIGTGYFVEARTFLLAACCLPVARVPLS
jgi:prefoldin subunit 5